MTSDHQDKQTVARRVPAKARIKSVKPRIRRFRFTDEAMNYPYIGYELRGRSVYRRDREGNEDAMPRLTAASLYEGVRLHQLAEVPSWTTSAES